jgi:D-ribose pyranose/furanose isomerase RbsD
MPGFKHLIECHCTLAIYKKNKRIIYHKFPVYSKVDDLDDIVKKLVQCNNCSAVHYVTGISKSEIKIGKDESNTIITVTDLMINAPEKLKNILITYKADISSWEHVLDIIAESRWGENIILSREINQEKESLKILEVNGKNKFSIKNETINNIIEY